MARPSASEDTCRGGSSTENRVRACYLPSGVRRSIQSSASVRVRSTSGLPMRFSRRSTPFSPRHSVARVFRRSTWLLRAFWEPPPFLDEAFSALPLSSTGLGPGSSSARDLWPRIGVGLERVPPKPSAGGASSPSESSSRAVAPTFTASRRARALARVSAIRIRCGTMLRPTLCGLASPMPEKRLSSSISAVALTMATLPLESSGTWMSSVSMPLKQHVALALPLDKELFSHGAPLASFPDYGLPVVLALEGDPIAHRDYPARRTFP